ncbi:MAG TPA: hypothetical protein VMW47_11040 [Verrucomicrobiae bacterium]|nr:hypothetical protein [Verrucomicrobiae bacterium]
MLGVAASDQKLPLALPGSLLDLGQDWSGLALVAATLADLDPDDDPSPVGGGRELHGNGGPEPAVAYLHHPRVQAGDQVMETRMAVSAVPRHCLVAVTADT